MLNPASLSKLSHHDVWQIIANQLQEELPRQSFLTWFKPLEPVSFDGDVLTLCTPSQFYHDWIESHYSNHIRQAVNETLGEDVSLKYTIDPNRKQSAYRDDPETETRLKPVSGNGEVYRSHLNQRYRFDSLIEGDCNRFAKAAAVTLAENPGRTSFNPLLLYGGSGLGKTHLMQAIGNHILEYGYAKKVLYVTSEKFTADFIKAIQSGSTENFSRIYRKVDVLLLDDVQYFMTKDKTQEQFFHTFNSLHHSGKQLVFSSDRPPRELEGFDTRLVSRLQWGLVSELRAPEFETRLAILKNRAKTDNITLPDEVANFLAFHVTDNIRTLEGALIHMFAQASLIGRKISIELAKEVIGTISTHPIQTVSVEQIQEITAREFNIPGDLMRSKTRKKEIVQARQAAMYLSTEFTNLTLKGIGLHFGGRDHATVIHARETINERMKSNSRLAETINRLKRKLEIPDS